MRDPTARPPWSLQKRLLVWVLGFVTVVWAAAMFMTWRATEGHLNELLDAHLAQAASLLAMQPLDELEDEDRAEVPQLHKYQRRVVFQVWHEGQLVARSANAPDQPLLPLARLKEEADFSTATVGNRSWRVFHTVGAKDDIQIVVGEVQGARDGLIWEMLEHLSRPVLIGLPLLALLLVWVVRRSVRPLRQLSAGVAERQPTDLQPLPEAGLTPEVAPLVRALNHLFDRMARMLASERRFTADAAHELRTPLAAIRMQVQVAQGAQSAPERQQALAATLQGCDRATRLIEQLLQLARLESNASDAAGTSAAAPVHGDWGRVLQQVVHDALPSAQARAQRIEILGIETVGVSLNATPDASTTAKTTANTAAPLPAGLSPILAGVLLRNLVDNALRYSPDGATVRVRLHPSDDAAVLSVEDSGPGLSDDDLKRLGDRFFRVLGTGQSGSGLGWSIVRRIADIHHLRVAADRSPTLGGLRVTLLR